MLKIRTICVTRADIENGLPRTPGLCPLAIAVRRIVNPRAIVMVSRLAVTVTVPGNRQWYVAAHDKDTHQFINDVDDGLCVQPIALTLKFAEIYR